MPLLHDSAMYTVACCTFCNPVLQLAQAGRMWLDVTVMKHCHLLSLCPSVLLRYAVFT